MKMMAILWATGAALVVATPATAQLDVMSYGDAAANLGRTQVMNNVINQQAGSGGRSAMTTKQRAQATCANKSSLRQRFGEDDPRTKKLYSMCAQAGY